MNTRKATTLVISALLGASLLSGCGSAGLTAQDAPSAQDASPAVLTAPEGCSGLRITELMSGNTAFFLSEDGMFHDWIELTNTGYDAAPLAGLFLSDDEDDPEKWALPDMTLAPGESTVILCQGDSVSDLPCACFSLSSKGETLTLSHSSGALIDSIAFGKGTENTSFVRDGEDMTVSFYPTPGYPNTSEGYDAYCASLPVPEGLVINEATVFDPRTLDDYGDTYDWVELKNCSSASLSLSGYMLCDSLTKEYRRVLPDITLGPGEIFTVQCSGDETLSDRYDLHAGFSLSDEGETVYLLRPDGSIADCIAITQSLYPGSVGRMDGCGGLFYFASASHAPDNYGGMRRIAPAPVSLSPDGIFEDVDSVKVELSGEGTVRYTLDGSMPDWDSAQYTGPIELTETAVVRARCFRDGAVPGPALTLSYIINEGHSLPVMSLVTDDLSYFDQVYNNGYKHIEVPGALSFYEPDGTFTIPCGITMNGETSLVMPKKNMALRFRGAYGQDKLKYDIYRDGGTAEFTNLLLRSGQDATGAIIRNELAQSLADMAGCRMINQRSIYGVLYVNGQYSGIYTLKEKSNEALYAARMGVKKDSVELLEADIPFESSLFQDVILFAAQHDMSEPGNYTYICSQIDIDSLIDWAFMEGFTANTDITNGNLRYARSPEDDGRWRMMFYDLDAAFRTTDVMHGNVLGGMSFQISKLLMPLMRNPDFRDAYLTRAAQLLRDVLTNEAVLQEIDRLADTVRPEVARDFTYHGLDPQSFEWNIAWLRDFITECNWRQMNIERLSALFDLTNDERAQYFGDIDEKHRA